MPRAIPRYDPRTIEPRWQQRWKELGLFRARDGDARPKSYCLMMFPYPSGDLLHVGHGRNYILGDVVVRLNIMRGKNVLAPMGWDAFGLPAENYAIQKGVHPAESTRANIARMKVQFDRWGLGYDWEREIATCDPSFYRWTQWLFLRLYEKGLAYRGEAPVNWCPSCATVLANEQVEADDTCERCGSPVEQKRLTQWFFRITRYADRLLDDMARLGSWPEKVKLMQRNWIGRSEGARIDFALDDLEVVSVFTTRADTLFGCTYMVLAPEHPVVARLERPEVRAFVERMKGESREARTGEDAPKEGVFTGVHAVNPATGERVPVWIANYVLMEYGTGAVMAVPAHDQRDFEFARKYGLPVKVVIRPESGEPARAGDMTEAFVDDGVMVDSVAVDDTRFDGMPSAKGRLEVTEWLDERGEGAPLTQFRIRDWLLSRQRYWGAPIPIVRCAPCGDVPVPEQDLPVLLPHDRGLDVAVRPTGTGKSPLANVPEFLKTTCPRCGGPAERETDTMDTFVDSSWYFLRYLAARDEARPFGRGAADYWLPVDQYIGGAEHATKHLIYARFVTKVLFDQGLVGFDEPFTNLFSQGLICKVSEKTGKLEKMSKSKGNVVTPDSIIQKFGADTQRLYTLFIGPPEMDAEWSDEAIVGPSRFLNRLWTAVHEAAPRATALGDPASVDATKLTPAGRELRRKTHETIGRVTADTDRGFQFNTAIAAVMELVNACGAVDAETAGDDDVRVLRAALEAATLLLAPMVPHVAEELWRALGHAEDETVFRVPWPRHDPELAKAATVEVVIQVNGKVRGREVVPRDVPEDDVRRAVLENPRVKGYLDGKQVVKTIVVPNKLVNLVVR